MKIYDLILLLNEYLNKHGDLDVVISNTASDDNEFELQKNNICYQTDGLAESVLIFGYNKNDILWELRMKKITILCPYCEKKHEILFNIESVIDLNEDFIIWSSPIMSYHCECMEEFNTQLFINKDQYKIDTYIIVEKIEKTTFKYR